jgi:hypothetical protein
MERELVTQQTVQIVCGILAVLCVLIIVLRRKKKKARQDEDF